MLFLASQLSIVSWLLHWTRPAAVLRNALQLVGLQLSLRRIGLGGATWLPAELGLDGDCPVARRHPIVSGDNERRRHRPH